MSARRWGQNRSETNDGVWFDEEPPIEIYTEGLTRTNNGQRSQFAIMTFTPLLGVSDVVQFSLTIAVLVTLSDVRFRGQSGNDLNRRGLPSLTQTGHQPTSPSWLAEASSELLLLLGSFLRQYK
jgi:phage terminase large subunit-like protein